MEYPFKLINGRKPFITERTHQKHEHRKRLSHGSVYLAANGFSFCKKTKIGNQTFNVLLFNIESRKMKAAPFSFLFFSPSNEKQELSFIFSFSFRNIIFFKQFEYSISTRERDFLLISADWSAAVLQGRSPPLLQVILDVYSNYSSYISNQISRQMNSSIQSLLLSSVIHSDSHHQGII